MYRHSPVRNQKSKGIKIKHVLQICLLIAICFWLIFQVKRSHDKKKELDTTDTKILKSTQNGDDVIKFGRKDLQPKLEETSKEIEKHEEEEEEVEEVEDEHEEEAKIEEEKDDEIDENEQEKSDMDFDQDDNNTLDEDKERDESDENENEERDGQSQTENGSSSEVHDQDGVARSTHEAREEHYKGDDASSAVTHGNSTLYNSIENIEMGISEQENRVDNDEEINVSQGSTIDLKEKNGEKPKNEASSNTTPIQEKGSDSGPSSNNTVITSDSTQSPNITEGVTVLKSSIAASDDDQSGSSSTLTDETRNIEGKSSISTNISEVVDSQTFSKSTTEENSSGSSQETSDSSETENPQKVQHETIDSTDLEDKEARTDLDNETEDGNREDTAVE